ncbi:PIN domain-containing protein [Moraxella sp. ZY210820]|uniref:PIN domain-containing protein n=1 Tax=unclassified Moraxella TaxID=2685852 RepID=UPI002731B561|nr:PIN domain-containing protein [Moraxella sp. ZY210820]WLF84764.1 PIN domain-containing protein [Moraxella sp. ZY210820]
MFIDTNILLRYILKDNLELAEQASCIISENKTICLNAVVYEAIHVMKNVYHIERTHIADELYGLFEDDIIGSENKKVILKTLTIFKETSLDFIDCLLIAEYMIHGTAVASFDKKLKNYIKRLSIC